METSRRIDHNPILHQESKTIPVLLCEGNSDRYTGRSDDSNHIVSIPSSSRSRSAGSNEEEILELERKKTELLMKLNNLDEELNKKMNGNQNKVDIYMLIHNIFPYYIYNIIE